MQPFACSTENSGEVGPRHPGGMPEGSRGSSGAMPPGSGMVRSRTPAGCQNQRSVRRIWHPAGMQEWLRTHRGYRRAVRSSTPGYLLASRRDGQESHGALLLLHRKQRRTFELNGSG